MRVTQSMLSNNMLRNLTSSYNKMGKLQDQLNTGKKINRPSDDPVVAMKGMGYRMQVDKVEQFKRNLGEVHNYLDSSDDALDGVGQALKRVQELTIDAANGTKTDDDRQKILKEIEQLREQIRDLGNTKVGDKYLFSGTKTGSPLFEGDPTTIGGVLPSNPPGKPVEGFESDVSIEVFDGVELKVNTNGYKLFSEVDDMMDKLITSIKTNEGSTAISDHLSSISKAQDSVLETRADIGARQNRAEMMSNRLDSQELSAIKQMSENEDIDYEKTITEMLTQESIHRAALSVGSRIIQPSLVDFLR
ncbi:flagellar hook-associated protein FlgL [Filibacter tadaridae]|uniref:Flagellar hook-associated protein 3 n=1 Tax=Filibacter tadaridae TaxID=2483811 RepID=A0A3P5WS61_9BACL|nr:flagellar hook-associated protein FlgL [Filibacter tadaridae]VDC24022.1 Flagellar hook-associated protein 3 [Filibacter tadaridae]